MTSEGPGGTVSAVSWLHPLDALREISERRIYLLTGLKKVAESPVSDAEALACLRQHFGASPSELNSLMQSTSRRAESDYVESRSLRLLQALVQGTDVRPMDLAEATLFQMWRLARMPLKLAFGELLAVEPRLAEVEAAARKQTNEEPGQAPGDWKRRHVALIARGLVPTLVGPTSSCDSAILRSPVANAVVSTYIKILVGGPGSLDDPVYRDPDSRVYSMTLR